MSDPVYDRIMRLRTHDRNELLFDEITVREYYGLCYDASRIYQDLFKLYNFTHADAIEQLFTFFDVLTNRTKDWYHSMYPYFFAEQLLNQFKRDHPTATAEEILGATALINSQLSFVGEDVVIGRKYMTEQGMLRLVAVGEKCRRCGSTNTIGASKQTRSADEGTSKLYTCNDCTNVFEIKN